LAVKAVEAIEAKVFGERHLDIIRMIFRRARSEGVDVTAARHEIMKAAQALPKAVRFAVLGATTSSVAVCSPEPARGPRSPQRRLAAPAARLDL
jgi:hypothetical protein